MALTGEEQVIARTGDAPATVGSLRSDFEALGVRPGSVLLVHASLSALGWVCGGAAAVIEALQETLGPRGTLVMPALTSNLTDPSTWRNPAVPRSWWETIRAETPPFDPAITPTWHMGVIAELFRTLPGTLRSDHPHVSFSARGPRASEIVSGHPLDFPLDEHGPLGRIERLGGDVLLLGVDHSRNTSLHLAEYRDRRRWLRRCLAAGPVRVNGRRQWVEYADLELDESDFAELGAAFHAEGGSRRERVGQGVGERMSQPNLLKFAVEWMLTHRGRALGR